MREVMYDKNSVLIAVILFVSMVVAIEVGARLGIRLSESVTKSLRSQVNSVQASLLGILALLLGFTFSQSLQRYDTRSAAVVEEANAIGTAYLRTDILPDEIREDSQALMGDYIANRIAAGAISLDRDDEREAIIEVGVQVQEALWQLAIHGASISDRPATMNLYLQSLNEMFDSNALRDAALSRHIPEPVLILLYSTFILTGLLVGYAAGVAGTRAPNGTYVLVALIVILVFIIIDLDRPRRGLIEVDQSSLVELRALTAGRL